MRVGGHGGMLAPMSRRARAVFLDLPHHVTQRGNYRQDVFLDGDDRERYLAWLAGYAQRYGLAVWAYCLMSNHVHLIAVPSRPDSLARTLAATHMRHSQAVNRERGTSGHLWQGRYYSCPLDDPHLVRAACYIERNPVRAGLVTRATEWLWSSARAHALGEADRLVSGSSWPSADLAGHWADMLGEDEDPSVTEEIRHHTSTGRPLGDEAFVARLEAMAGRVLRALAPGRPRKAKAGTG